MAEPVDDDVRAALARGDTARATELILRAHGPELVGWLTASLPEADAYEAFSRTSEELWKSLARWAGQCSIRTWCYMLARQAAARVRTEPRRAREELVSSLPSAVQAVEEIWNTTRANAKREQDVYAQIRAELAEEDQWLLVLRVDRELAWRDIAIVLLGDATAEDELTRKAAALRKQFERVKDQLRAAAGRLTKQDP